MAINSRKTVDWIDSKARNGLKKNKYRPYHRKIQKKESLFSQDWFYGETKNGTEIDAGNQKQAYRIDDTFCYDWAKDGNKV